ncbi:MAG: hypothetical protein KDC95_23300, partial [Planctomycetes bacterium]|nr:hypothetical protein [Planctomycetota bacterium]
MGIYNLLEYDGDCPFCGVRWRFVAQTYFGWRDVLSYAVGDVFVWHPGGGLRVRGGSRRDPTKARESARAG